ncbi:NF-kappa-B inhibitor zeta [Pseudorasbora parva]|uniref:NF-kappa-B inhibitor zeta n=1 Tax=Pseudorasbora parva TaxID=51549 RepID=UPI00351F2D31
MIIDGVSEGFSAFLDRDTDVMTSPLHLWSFYGGSSPTEPSLSSGSPNSDSDHSWSDAGSPRDCVNEELKRNRYQGVRVKNTVKELILQKRHHHTQAQQFQTERECPAMMACLLQRKREADTLSPSAVKRLRTTDGAFLSPCGRAESVFQEMLEDIGEVLSIESVTVNGCYPDLCDRNPDPGPAQGHSGQGSLTPMFSSFSSSTPMSFFQWQIQQEEQKLMNLSTAELTTRDGDGDTFLHIAVAQGRRALAFVLARKMAAIDMLDMKEHNQQSAFQVSVAADQHLIAQDLLSLGAEINTMDSWGRSPLHVCAEKGHAPTLQAIQKFMQTSGRPVNVEVVNYEGLTPLHVAVLSHNAVVQELECVGTQSPALLQKRKLLSECIGTLLLMGAALNSKDRKSGRSALHMAAEEANIELLRLFLDQPSYFSVVNAKAFNGNTALHMASALQGRQAQLDAVRLLLRRGADPGAKNLENEQPAQLVPEGPLGDQVRRILKGKGAHSRS